MILLVAIAVSAVGWLSYRNLEQALLPRALDRIETHSRLVATDLESYAAQRALAMSPAFGLRGGLNGVIRAHIWLAASIPSTASPKRRGASGSQHVSRPNSKPSPSIRDSGIIGIEDDGREVVRVDRSGPNGSGSDRPRSGIAASRQSRLLSGTRSGCTQAKSYVSPLDLNEENGTVETPHVPTLRVATPVFAPDGKPFGIVIVNVDMRPALDRVRSSVRPGESDLRRQRPRRLSRSPRSLARIRLAARQAPTIGRADLPRSGDVARSDARVRARSYRIAPDGRAA